MSEPTRAQMVDDLVQYYDEGFDYKIIRTILREGWIGVEQWTDEEVCHQWDIVYGGEEE